MEQETEGNPLDDIDRKSLQEVLEKETECITKIKANIKERAVTSFGSKI